MQNWKKLGRVFVPDGSVEWMKTHASVPFIGDVSGNYVKVYSGEK